MVPPANSLSGVFVLVLASLVCVACRRAIDACRMRQRAALSDRFEKTPRRRAFDTPETQRLLLFDPREDE